MSTFNGQINISRDLHQNKRTIFANFDITDLIFLALGFISLFFTVYLLSFVFKIVDEFTAIIISLFPLIIFITLGFKRISGIRAFNYIRLLLIDKKNLVRFHWKYDNSQIGERYIAGLIVDEQNKDKYINTFLNYKNLSVLSIRYIYDDEKCKYYVLFILSLRYSKRENKYDDLAKKFLKVNDITALSADDILELEKDLSYKFLTFNSKDEIIRKLKRKIFINLCCKHLEHVLIKNEIELEKKRKKYCGKEYRVFMLNIYDTKKYNDIISDLKNYADIVCYFKKVEGEIYVNTFLMVEYDSATQSKNFNQLKVDEICNKHGVILDNLSKNQIDGRFAMSYLLTNNINGYRKYIS